ncbi:MAG: YraN family protein [Acidobacteria bacterium]|nr:YraN family protein [Acidobacteriota bacterium]
MLLKVQSLHANTRPWFPDGAGNKQGLPTLTVEWSDRRLGFRRGDFNLAEPAGLQCYHPCLLFATTIRALDRLVSTLGRSPQRAAHLAAGARGEDEAFFYLRKLGFTVIARDFRSPRRPGDIDLIAIEKNTLCFVEVKTRSRRDYLPAETAVDEQKRKTLSALAREYLRQYAQAQGKSPAFRFDVISIYLESNGQPDITLFRDAFPMS